MHRIDVDGCHHIETGLLETQAEPARAGEEVNTDGSRGTDAGFYGFWSGFHAILALSHSGC